MRRRKLARLVDRFAEAPSWERSRRLLAHHPELAGQEAEDLLSDVVTVARRSGDHDTADHYDYYRAVLRRCREIGPDQVFLELTADEDDDELVALANEAAAALQRYERDGHAGDLVTSIEVGEAVVDRAIAVPTRTAALANLGLALLARADRHGATDDFRRAVTVLREAVSHTPPGVPERLSYMRRQWIRGTTDETIMAANA